MRVVHADCRHYRGDRPCAPHKREGVVCQDCPHHDPVARRIAIIKLAAMGDVLRTTAILPALRERHPGAHVTWVTEPACVPLLERNPLIDRVLLPDATGFAQLRHEAFDLCACLDLDPQAATLAAEVDAASVRGFTRDARGGVLPHGPAAAQWYAMSLWDDLKKANQASIQEHLFSMLDLTYQRERPILALTRDEIEAGRRRLAEHNRPRVGLNLGGGGRWRYKRWNLESFTALARRLATELQAVPVLLYGPPEAALAREVMAQLDVPFIDARPDNPVRDFAALIGACDLLVTGDTLALHLAVALHVPVVALFGPTSATEIDLYEQGRHIVADIPCQCCYLSDCDVRPTCMDRIEVATVAQAVEQVMRL